MNDPVTMNRRDFMIATGVVAAGTLVTGCAQTQISAPPLAGAAMGAGGRTVEEIFDRPMRWGQLVLVDNDPGNYDAGFWLDYFKRTRCDGVNLSAGGCVAFYPTKIPYHYKSAWMKDGTDPFGE